MIEYSAIAGAIGAGRLGYLAVNYGYQQFDSNIMISCIVALILLLLPATVLALDEPVRWTMTADIAPDSGVSITPVGIGDGNQLDQATTDGQYMRACGSRDGERRRRTTRQCTRARTTRSPVNWMPWSGDNGSR